jgi:hypothetical protein
LAWELCPPAIKRLYPGRIRAGFYTCPDEKRDPIAARLIADNHDREE